MTEQSRMRGISAMVVSFTTWPRGAVHWVGRDRVVALLTPVIRLFATCANEAVFRCNSKAFIAHRSIYFRAFIITNYANKKAIPFA